MHVHVCVPQLIMTYMDDLEKGIHAESVKVKAMSTLAMSTLTDQLKTSRATSTPWWFALWVLMKVRGTRTHTHIHTHSLRVWCYGSHVAHGICARTCAAAHTHTQHMADSID